jgi:hypothetical protein
MDEPQRFLPGGELMKFRVLNPRGSDGREWTNLIHRLPDSHRDIHFLKEYGLIYHKTYRQEPFLAVYGDETQFVVQAFVKRPLNELAFLKEKGITEPYYDIANPYGYGGPLYCCDSFAAAKDLYREFHRHFSDYACRSGFASQFTSCHPLLGNHTLLEEADVGITPVQQKKIVYVDLTLPEATIFSQFNRGNKSNINQAQRAGVTVEETEPSPENFRRFNALYYHTMQRNNAGRRWFFPEDYFSNCWHQLGTQRVSLFFAYVAGQLASAFLLIHDFTTVYYHFGASDERFFSYKPNNLLMYRVIRWARQQGYRKFHLGGGVGPDTEDSLFRFKKGFSRCRAWLYLYYRVLNEDVYRQLCRWKIKHERETLGKESDSGFFPLYRRDSGGDHVF